MTIFYPDISGFQAGIDLKGALAVCCKATEGTFYTNPDYGRARANAISHGAFFFAYHFLHAGNGAAQAEYAYNVVGKNNTPLMLDIEPTVLSGAINRRSEVSALAAADLASVMSDPTLADVAAFVDTYRKLGGIVHLNYLPEWYHAQLGSPSLSAWPSLKLGLVSSDYTTYTDASSGGGWLPYGGIVPLVWQYTDALNFNGHTVDFNAFRGHYAGKQDPADVAACLTEFKSIVTTGSYPPAPAATGTNPVSGFTVTPNDIGVDFQWDAASGATSYRVNIWTPGSIFTRKLVVSYVTEHTNMTIFHLGHGESYVATVLANPASVWGSLHRAKATFTTK